MANESVTHTSELNDEAEFLRLLRLLKVAGKMPEFLATLRTLLAERAA
jgi:hypothetical protein